MDEVPPPHSPLTSSDASVLCSSARCGDSGDSSDHCHSCSPREKCGESEKGKSSSGCTPHNAIINGLCSNLSDGCSNHDHSNNDSNMNCVISRNGDSKISPVKRVGENDSNCSGDDDTIRELKNDSEFRRRHEAQLAWSDQYGPDEYEHPVSGVVYITSSVLGPGADVELFQHMPRGCRCLGDCSSVTSAKVHEKQSCKRSLLKNPSFESSDTNCGSQFECVGQLEGDYLTRSRHYSTQDVVSNSEAPRCTEKKFDHGVTSCLCSEETRSVPSISLAASSCPKKVMASSLGKIPTSSPLSSVSRFGENSLSSSPKSAASSFRNDEVNVLVSNTEKDSSCETLHPVIKTESTFCECMARVPQTYSQTGLLLHSDTPWPVYECNDDCGCPGVDLDNELGYQDPHQFRAGDGRPENTESKRETIVCCSKSNLGDDDKVMKHSSKKRLICGNRVVQRGPRKGLMIVKNKQENQNRSNATTRSNLSICRRQETDNSSSEVPNDSLKSFSSKRFFEKTSKAEFCAESSSRMFGETNSPSELTLHTEEEEIDGPLCDSHPSKGYCVVTKNSIPRGAFICEYAGEIIGVEEAKRRFAAQDAKGKSNYILVLREHRSEALSSEDPNACEAGVIKATSSHGDGLSAKLSGTQSGSNCAVKTSLGTGLIDSQAASNPNSFNIAVDDCEHCPKSCNGVPCCCSFKEDESKSSRQDSNIQTTCKDHSYHSSKACPLSVGEPTAPDAKFESVSTRKAKPLLTIIDPTCLGNIGRYLNHSCEPNVQVVPVRVNSMVPLAAMFALRHIEAGEELVYDYSSACLGAEPGPGWARAPRRMQRGFTCCASGKSQEATFVDVELHDRLTSSDVAPDYGPRDLEKLQRQFTFTTRNPNVQESSPLKNLWRKSDNSSSSPWNRSPKRRKIDERKSRPVHHGVRDEHELHGGHAARTPCLCRSLKCRGFLPSQTDLF